MSLLRRLCLLSSLVVCAPVISGAQAGDPIRAIEEMVTTDKLTDVLKHYPVAVEELVQGLPLNEKAEAAKRLLIKPKYTEPGYELHKSSDGRKWQIVDQAGQERFTFTLVNSYISGSDALIMMEVDFDQETKLQRFLSLRLEAGEWRLKGLGNWYPERDFESADFIQELTSAGRNAIQAEATLYKISSVLQDYRNTYKSIGFPPSLVALSGPAENTEEKPGQPPTVEAPQSSDGGEKPDGVETAVDDGSESEESEPVAPQYVHMLEPLFMETPALKDGYEFRYVLVNAGAMDPKGGAFQITATPVQFGKTGNRNYFIDQTLTIRFTTENRVANENDQPLHHGPVDQTPEIDWRQ